MIELSQRLQTLADFVPQGSRLADIGTDHGFLPCYLAQQQRILSAVACDIRSQPLALAQKNIESYGLTKQVQTRLGNGLQVLAPQEVDVVTISGMGGSLMTEILDAAPQVRNSLHRLILQPNVAAELIRRWAMYHHWDIVEEELLQEKGRFYVVIVLEPGQGQTLTAIAQQLGPKLLEKRHPLLVGYLREEWSKAKYILNQLQNSDSEESKQKALLLKKQWADINEVIKCQMGINL